MTFVLHFKLEIIKEICGKLAQSLGKMVLNKNNFYYVMRFE